MRVDRRQCLTLGRSLAVLCASSPISAALGATRANRDRAALLVPLTGPSAALGLSMQRAASLVQSPDPKVPPLMVLDSGGTPAGAAAAATRAIKGGAKLILGPLFTAEVRPVVQAAGTRATVITFSNDAGLYDSGAFVLGITAQQATTAVLRYGRQRGLRRVALIGGGGGWGAQVAAAAGRVQSEIGIEILPVARPAVIAPATVEAALRAAGSPDALLVPDGGAAFLEVARALGGSDVQLLGTTPALNHTPGALQAMSGAWIAAPNPAAFATFATRYQAQHGGTPGAIAALAHDGALILNTLRAGGRIDRAALLAVERFPGVTGTLRFRSDGSCARDLAILTAGPDGYTVAAESVAA